MTIYEKYLAIKENHYPRGSHLTLNSPSYEIEEIYSQMLSESENKKKQKENEEIVKLNQNDLDRRISCISQQIEKKKKEQVRKGREIGNR